MFTYDIDSRRRYRRQLAIAVGDVHEATPIIEIIRQSVEMLPSS